MSDSRDKKQDPAQPTDAHAKRSGRVAFDSRGNSVWEWQVQTGIYSRDVNTESVRQLDLNQLSLQDTAAVRALGDDQPQHPAREAGPKQPPKLELEKTGGGFNPYDNSPASRSNLNVRDPYDNARLHADALRTKRVEQESAPRKPVTFSKQPPTELRKLNGWMKLKRALTGKK